MPRLLHGVAAVLGGVLLSLNQIIMADNMYNSGQRFSHLPWGSNLRAPRELGQGPVSYAALGWLTRPGVGK